MSPENKASLSLRDKVTGPQVQKEAVKAAVNKGRVAVKQVDSYARNWSYSINKRLSYGGCWRK